jgi:hypothetical protein
MSKPRGDPSCGTSSEDVLIPTERHPAYRQREARSGSGTERENLADDAKGKGASGSHREAESTDASERGGLPRSSDEGPVMGLERRRWVIAADVGQLVRRGRSPLFSGRRQSSCDGTSRMMREYPVRICEGLWVNFPGRTRQSRRFGQRAFPDQRTLPTESIRSERCQEVTWWPMTGSPLRPIAMR